MPKMVDDLSVADAEKLLDLFIHCCRVGVELDLPPEGLAGTLQAYAKTLGETQQPLQYYVDNPRGVLRRAVSEKEVAEAKAEARKVSRQGLDSGWKDF